MKGLLVRWGPVLGMVASAMLAPSVGAAFNSYPIGAPHDQIIRAACAAVGWSKGTASEWCAAVRRPDRSENRWAPGLSPMTWLRFRPNAQYRPAHHFDRPPHASDAEAFADGAAYVRTQADAALAAIRAGRREQAILAGGRSAHALSDLYAHSNLVDLPDSVVARVEAAIWNPADSVVRELRLTGYDPAAKDPERPSGDSYSHGEWSKDSAGKNAEARSLIGTQSKFSRARELATHATERLLRRLESEVSRERWDPIR